MIAILTSEENLVWHSRTRSNIGISGFENVFLNEMKYDSAIGLHNWIYFYHKENRTGRVHDLDYKGYMNTLKRMELIRFFPLNSISISF